jgi:hypothetical protein
MHKKSAIFVKQATIGTVFTVKSVKRHPNYVRMIKLFAEHESSFIDSVNQKLKCSISRYDYYKSKQACLKQAK